MSKSDDKRKLPEYSIPADLKEVLLKDVKYFDGISEKSEKFLKILKKLEKIDQLELAEQHYLEFLKFALYLEEYQQSVDQQVYNMYGQSIKKSNEFTYTIDIGDLDKDHPLKRSCSAIAVSEANSDKNCAKCCLKIMQVYNDHFNVSACRSREFRKNYNPNKKYNIEFCYNNYSFRCSHYAIFLIKSRNATTYLFPKINDKRNDDNAVRIKLGSSYNEMILENPEQKQAVLNILNKSSFPVPYILYGPPGTGKTSTLVEAMCQIYYTTTENILVCTPSNAAADEITTRLLKYISDENLYRIYSLSKNFSEISDDIKKCSNSEKEQRLRVVSSKRIVISTLCTCTKLSLMKLSNKFSYVFIDEIGQATEPEALIVFNVISHHGNEKCQLILAGDPKQLGPTVRSKYAEPILGQSILERLMKLDLYMKNKNHKYDSNYITKLLRNYRSHPAIIHVSNKLYYDNELIPYNNQNEFISNEFPLNFPIIFHAVHGKEKKSYNSPSSFNQAEVIEVIKYANLLIGKKIGDKIIGQQDIGIVTPFVLQCKNIHRQLYQENLKDVMVGTVETFQGQEKNVIIISTVRSEVFMHEEREHLGFLSNPRRFNVALTRARSVLVVVGNPYALQKDYNWRYFIQFCRDNDALRGSRFVRTDELEKEKNDNAEYQRSDKRNAHSIDLFRDIVQLLPLDDGVIEQEKSTYVSKRLLNDKELENSTSQEECKCVTQ